MRNLLRFIGIVGDYLLLIVSLSIVIYVRTSPEIFDFVYKEYLRIFAIFFIFWVILFAFFDLYNFIAPPKFTRFFLCLTLCILITASIFYGFSISVFIAPKTNLGIFAVIFSLLFYFWRRILDNIFVKYLHGHEIMMAVSDTDSLELAVLLVNNSRYKYTVNGILVTNDLLAEARQKLPSDIIYSDILDFEQSIKESHILTIVSTSVWFTQLYGTMYELLPRTIRIINMINFYERVLGYIPVHSTSQYWIMNNIDFVSRRIYMVFKRILDLILVLILLPFMLPLMLMVVFILKFFGEKKAPVVFSQKRVGLYNKEFVLYKFRTMKMDAEKYGAQWAVKKDPRITKIGRMLRLTRLDELPQIFNVIKGDMSFIGPRPERMEFIKTLSKEIPHYHLRHIIKPGLTGWAQVKFRYGSSVDDSAVKLCYDLYYIKNVNVLLDLRIMFKTFITVLTAAGQ